MIRMTLKALFLTVVLFLSGCATITPPTPAKDLPERLAYGYASAAAVAHTVIYLYETKKIDREHALTAYGILAEVDKYLTTAVDLHGKGLQESSEQQLSMALRLLTLLEMKLREMEEDNKTTSSINIGEEAWATS